MDRASDNLDKDYVRFLRCSKFQLESKYYNKSIVISITPKLRKISKICYLLKYLYWDSFGRLKIILRLKNPMLAIST